MLKNCIRIGMGILFIVAGSLHFLSRESELKIIPDFLPLREEALFITGLLEIVGGMGLLISKLSRAAAFGLVALLVLVFPANIYHALKNIQLGGLLNSPVYQWARLPLQGVFIWLVLWSTASKKNRKL